MNNRRKFLQTTLALTALPLIGYAHPVVSTFSIVSFDPEQAAWGVAVASKFLAVGSVVSWAQAGAGAVATQAFSNRNFGPDGLTMLAAGKSAEATLAALLAADERPAIRQVALIDAQGKAAAHTGADCPPWAGHQIGQGFACQGNLVAGPDVVAKMAASFAETSGDLGDRLLSALAAGERAGGDRRGRQSAALLVVQAGRGYGGNNDRYIDLRVDDHPEPISRLLQLREKHRGIYGIYDPRVNLQFEPIGPEEILFSV